MQKEANFLSGLASLMANAYATRTGKSKKDIQSMMDSETWLFGEEIKAAGFVAKDEADATIENKPLKK
jgi:ATP-dependent protease ClpP protease subunit